jgi:predicted transcriptional regulator
MNVQLLIDNVVRQTTVLIAQLATSGGVRAPLAHIANDVFLHLSRELSSQGVSRRVSADMFGLALRSYRRRIHRLTESSTDRNRSLWEAVLDFLSQGAVKTRGEVLRRFGRDDETIVKSVLHDLCESGLVFRLGSGRNVGYRAATTEELEQMGRDEQGFAEWLWLVVYREGPIAVAELCERVGKDPAQVEGALEALCRDGHVTRSSEGLFGSQAIVLEPKSSAGWEVAMFDHFQAVVRTMCQKLRAEEGHDSEVGGSTYGFRIWPGHPLEEEVRGALGEFRARYTDLRRRVQQHNAEHGLPKRYQQVILYGGQCVVDQDDDNDDNTEANDEQDDE